MKALFKSGTQASTYNHNNSGEMISQPPQQQNHPPEQNIQLIERLRVEIPNAHVFKLPPKAGAGGWRGADWREKVWQGTVKVVERRREQGGAEEATILLVDRTSSNIFAVCPVTGRTGAVDRCVDSSRYFVLRIENVTRKHMFVGLAFNERNDAFDFNTALEDSRREKGAEKAAAAGGTDLEGGQKQDYSIKDGQKIRIALPKNTLSNSLTEEYDGSPDSLVATRRRARQKRHELTSSNNSAGFLAPSSKDTPSHRTNDPSPVETKSPSILRKFF